MDRFMAVLVPFRGMVVINPYSETSLRLVGVLVPFRGMVVINCSMDVMTGITVCVLVPFRGMVVINPMPQSSVFMRAAALFCGAKSFSLKSPQDFTRQSQKTQYLCGAAQKWVQKCERGPKAYMIDEYYLNESHFICNILDPILINIK